MPKPRKEMTKIFDIAEKMHLEPSHGSALLMGSSQAVHSVVVRQDGGWKTAALACVSAALVVTAGLAFYAFHRVSSLNDEMDKAVGRMDERIQKLDSGLSFEGKRQQLLLGVRDEILKANPKAGLNEAYRYAEWLLKACEKYPSVDPLMFLSIGIVESGFNPGAVSHANARGLYQIWPSTGRMLARALNWEYTDEMLFDPQMNTEMAALYLDILFSAYRDERMVLAEYNGGPLNAGYWRAGSHKTASETRDYVLKVMDVHERVKSKFDGGMASRLDFMHLDAGRNGKVLGGAPPSVPLAPSPRREVAVVAPVAPVLQ